MLEKNLQVACLFLFAALTNSLASAQTKLPSVMDYVNYPDFRSAKLSPDGAYIALVAPKENKETLMILDAKTIQPKAAFDTLQNNKISRFVWANEERIVFETTINPGGDDVIYGTGDIYAFNVDNTKKFILGGPTMGDDEAYSILDPLDDDHDHILVVSKVIRNGNIARSRPTAMKIDIYKERTRSAGRITVSNVNEETNSPFPWGDIFADNSGNIRLAVMTGDDGKLQIKLREDGHWQDIASFLETSNDIVSPIGRPLGFNSSNDGIYYNSFTPQGRIALSLFDLKSHQSTLLYAHDKYDIGEPLTSSDDKELIGVEIMGPQPEHFYFAQHPDVAFRKSIDKSFAGYRVSFLNFTKDQRKGLAMVSGTNAPPGLFMLDRDTNTFSPLFSSRPRLQGSPMTKAETLTIAARDGMKIESYLTKAAGVQGPAPLVVLIHGGPHGIRDEPVFNTEVKLLASRGYSVLQVNYRGSGGYGAPFQASGYRHWGTAMIDDIIDATRFVSDKGFVKADQICVMGGSYGGYATMMALARYPDMFKCGIGISGLYDLNLMRKSDVPFYPGGKSYLNQVLGTDEKELDANSPSTLAGSIKVPVFLAHGGRDKRTPEKNADVFKKALDAAHVKYEWLYVESAGHGFSLPANREKLYTEVFKFLGANLH